MNFTKSVILMAGLSVCCGLYAQEDVVRQINEYGKFDSWCRREVKESGLIGGNTEHLYEFYGDTTQIHKTGKTPFAAPEGYLWRKIGRASCRERVCCAV